MSDISVYVLKPFPFSRNGIKEEQAEASATIDLPGRLFDGLNKEGYVRRAVIGDGHITLQPAQTPNEQRADAGLAPITASPAPAEPVVPSHDAVVAPAPSTVVVPAPQPPAATSDLTKEELAALADGTWKDWRFFKQRSVAAKLVATPVKDGADAKAAIEAYIASKAL